VDGGLRLDHLTDVGTEPSFSARLSAALTRALSAEAYAGRAFRAPTFYEKYGPPLGYTRANPALRPEDGVEAGAGLRYARGGLQVDASLFGARLSRAILYLNRNAYEVRPENAGSLWRGGGELSAALRPKPYLQQGAGVELLVSRLDATGAPVPTSPLLRLRSRTELSFARLWSALPLRVYLDGRAQSQSSSNYHGELTVPAQASLDAGLAYAIGERGSLAVEVRNLLGADSRVDMHQVPLPGRQLMASLVLGV
jgi:vitamin B12 transporter